eukprot:TRINITY_DN8869_c1_g1_i2.p1 TRINITY_DN8869_c1_g1~~TRINITY_DN8869_c1_g1_i2.p1  ORF type:complete len:794 (+),score=161.69 TRINITY_DN8869_c1_g1_i2:407-2788(+)
MEGELTHHPCGLPYDNFQLLPQDLSLSFSKYYKQPQSFVFCAKVSKLGTTAQTRVLTVASNAVYLWSVDKTTAIRRLVPILEIGQLVANGSSLGIVCPTQFDMLLKFSDPNHVTQAIHVLQEIYKYLRDDGKTLTAITNASNLRKQLRIKKPSDWLNTTVPLIPILSRQRVLETHNKREADKEEKEQDRLEELKQQELFPTVATSSASSSMSPQGGKSESPRSVQFKDRAENQNPEDDRRDSVANASHEDQRAQMEANLEALQISAAEWERKYTVLRARESQLEKTNKNLTKGNAEKDRQIEELRFEMKNLENQCNQLKKESDYFKRERLLACEALGVSVAPNGETETSLTEAARRLESHHEGLSDTNWRLTKEVAELTKKLDLANRGEGKLAADAEALKNLIQIRSHDIQTSERQHQNSKQLNQATRSLHKSKQEHEETKLQLFDMQQKYESLENRFRDHTTNSKATISKLEKKLKELLGGVEEMPEDRPRFNTRREPSLSIGATPKAQGGHHHHHIDSELKEGTRVLVQRRSTPEPCRGAVRYIGRLHGKAGEWIGVELDDRSMSGSNNGSVEGKQYFQTEDGRGVFVRASAVAVESIHCGTCEVRKQRSRSVERSPSRSVNRSLTETPAPPPYPTRESNPSGSNEYLNLAIDLKSQLNDAEDRIKEVESALGEFHKNSQSPARAASAERSPMPVLPPQYQNDNTVSIPSPNINSAPYSTLPRRARSRSPSASPSMVPQHPYEAAMRQALSSCVNQLVEPPRQRTRKEAALYSPTAADIKWARQKTLSEGL